MKKHLLNEELIDTCKSNVKKPLIFGAARSLCLKAITQRVIEEVGLRSK